MRNSFIPAAFIVVMLSGNVWAQAGAGQSFDQYPSFIELTSTRDDGTQSVLRCGYSSPNGHGVSADPGYREISVMNPSHKSYSRIQHIDNDFIATSIDPNGSSDLLLELVKADGTVAAKKCQTNTENDTISNCQTIQPFTFVDQVKAGDQKIGSQCADLVRRSASRMNPALADPQKTEMFKAGLRQKVGILASP